MLQSSKLLMLSGQFWLRMALAFLIPYILFSGIMQTSQDAINEALSEEPEKPRLAIIGAENAPSDLLQVLQKESIVRTLSDKSEILVQIDADSIDIGLVFPVDFYKDSSFHGEVEVYYNSIQNGRAVGDVLDIVEEFEDGIVRQAVEKIGLSETVVNPIKLEKTNTFNAFLMVGKIMEQVKGVLSNILNLLFIIMVLWLTRNLMLRLELAGGATKFVTRLLLTYSVTILATILVFIGFQMGIATEVEGMVRSIILSVQQLLVWNKLGGILLLWLPTWLFIIGLMGCLMNSSKDMVKIYTRTFWAGILIHVVAIIGLIPIDEIGYGQACLPIWNVFGVGQLSMRGMLDGSIWYVAMGAATFWAVLVNVVWYRLQRKS